MRNSFPVYSDQEILAHRTKKNPVSVDEPYAFLVEQECNAAREVVSVATFFLTNRECPLRCLMCDLWKNTTDEPVSPGAIPKQIHSGFSQVDQQELIREVKLYNSGSFFDRKAIPLQDYPEIARLVSSFDTVIVENHPALCGDLCLEFRDLIAPAQLEIAIGLETVHAELLSSLNKKMTLEKFEQSCEFLHREGINTRAFILLKPPFLSEQEGVDWAMRSLDYAFQNGVGCCSIIPTRTGNGMMEKIQVQGDFSLPQGSSLEEVLALGIARNKGRVFIDLWDAEKFFACSCCAQKRIARLEKMNLTQTLLPEIECGVCYSGK